MAYKFDISRGEEILLKAASIGAALLGLVGVYSFYMNNVWKPDIVVKKVDFANGLAEIEINGEPLSLKGDSTYLIRFDWGVRLGFTFNAQGKRVYDRIEVIKRGMVDRVIRKADEPA